LYAVAKFKMRDRKFWRS